MTCIQYISLAKDVVLIAAAFIGSWVAIRGLGTWQKQLKGKSEHDLSRRLLVSLFKYRDAINGVRHPAMWAAEMPSPPEEEAKAMSRDEIRFYGISKAYQARWDDVNQERTDLYADLLEAEALWGEDLKELYKVLFTLQHELLNDIRNFVELINPDTNRDDKEAITKIRKEARKIMYDDLSEEGDEFKNEFKIGVEGIEKYLKPKLAH